MILIKNMGMPKRCYDCGFYKSMHEGIYGDYCGALRRRFNEGRLDICPFEEKLSDCPLIEVVRCRECKYFDDEDYGESTRYCTWHESVVKADDFCSYGCREGE